jgi:cation transporter-like permease
MKSERLINAVLRLLVAGGLFYSSTTLSYDPDDVLSTTSYNDVVGPAHLIALILGIYGLVQLYKAFFK